MSKAAPFIALIAAGLAALAAPPAIAQEVTVRADLGPARRLLALACSNGVVDEAAVRADPLVKAQLAHHGGFGPQYSIDAYLAGLRSIARCEVPSPDPFRMAALVDQRERMTKAIGFLAERQDEIGRLAAERIRPYVPEGFRFTGAVVPVAASFSCGGFARDGAFFIDIPCVAENIEGEYDAIVRVVAHETYHRIQAELRGPQPTLDRKTVAGGQQLLFAGLLNEGSASLVGDARSIQGDGTYAKFSREISERNYRHLVDDFLLIDHMVEAVATKPDKVEARLRGIYGLAFGGRFGEHGYTVGQQMSAEIADSFGTRAIACLVARPPEQFVLAYAAALADGKKQADSHPLSEDTIAVARALNGAAPQPCLAAR